MTSGYEGHAVTRSGVATDLLVHAFLLACGALEFGLVVRSSDFFAGDTTYFELARSIVDAGFYGFNFRPQTTLPPGFPALIALLCVTVGCGYAVLIRSMAVFATLGLMASYELLRREQGRAVAGAVCVLVASSPTLFMFSTFLVLSDLPYLFTSMAALGLASVLDSARSVRARVAAGILCGCFLVASLLIRSAGIALLAGLVGWLAASWLADRDSARRRLKTFLPLLLVGLMVQALWVQWAAKREVLEWPVEGYPRSYMSQLRVKNGNHPELGIASLSDIPPRVARNLGDRGAVLVALLTRKAINRDWWFSPLVLGPAGLVVLGVACSVGRGGGRWPEWYFASHEAMYLLWPWDLEIRFFLPVAPLACLYLWRGTEAFLGVAFEKPRAAAAWSLPLSVVLGAYAGAAAWTSGRAHPALAAIFWAALLVVSVWTVSTDPRRLSTLLGRLRSRAKRVVSLGGRSLTVPAFLGAVTLVILVGVGIGLQLREGRSNLMFDVTRSSTYPDILAGQWIHTHTAATAVVMARQVDVVYHYGRRKVVWFPPLSDPELLMEGIRKYGVQFVIVISRTSSYWLPPDQDCFQPLVSAYPHAFRLLHEEPGVRIFEITSEPAGPGRNLTDRLSKFASVSFVVQ